jgi:hypothetical protein
MDARRAQRTVPDVGDTVEDEFGPIYPLDVEMLGMLAAAEMKVSVADEAASSARGGARQRGERAPGVQPPAADFIEHEVPGGGPSACMPACLPADTCRGARTHRKPP